MGRTVRIHASLAFCLTGLLGGCSTGCTQSAVVPPPTSISGPSSRSVPEISRTPIVLPTPARPIQPGDDPFAEPVSNSRWPAEAEPREWRYIVIHHTATSSGSVESIHENHLARKWLGIGYHFVIGNGNGMPDGEIESTFRWRQQLHGAHAGKKDYNDQGIGVALIGNFEEAPPSELQLRAVKRLVAELKAEHAISSANVIGHRGIKATACPGRFFPIDEVSLIEPGPQLSEAGGATNRATQTVATGNGIP